MKPLHGKHILITAGPTWEMLDPVRFLSNRSSGLMGFEIAKAAARAGAKVTLITGPVALTDPKGVNVVHVVSATEMYRACLKHFSKMDIAIMTAAVSDYRPATIQRHKIKKCLDTGSGAGMTLKLVRNPDILATLGRRKKRHQTLVGFALESRDLLKHAREKLRRKNCDLIVANAVPTLGAPTISATLLYNDGQIRRLPRLSKSRLAATLLKAVCPIMRP
jgi:phosphopantothenoylcysteine decarboxylase/phosphopantothenate--cysteine ligase